MTILLFGFDTYRSRQKLSEIIENYKKIRKSGPHLIFFDGEELNFETFREEVQSSSMFAEKKLIILRNIFSNQEFKEKFLKNAKKFVNSTDLILFHEENGISANDKLFKLLKKSGRLQEFKLLEGTLLKNWIKKEIGKYKIKAVPDVADKLVDFIGNDTWRLANEVQKLASFKKGKDIRIEDVELLVKPEIETDIFETIDAIASRRKKRALELLHQHVEKGDNPLYLFSMVNFQFRNLLMVRELVEKNLPYYSILKKTQLNPFVFKKTYQQVQRFSLSELKKIYRKIFQADLDIKTGRIQPELALDLLVSGI